MTTDNNTTEAPLLLDLTDRANIGVALDLFIDLLSRQSNIEGSRIAYLESLKGKIMDNSTVSAIQTIRDNSPNDANPYSHIS